MAILVLSLLALLAIPLSGLPSQAIAFQGSRIAEAEESDGGSADDAASDDDGSSDSSSDDGSSSSSDSSEEDETANSWRYTDGEIDSDASTDETLMSLLTGSHSTWRESFGTSCYGIVSGSSTTEVAVSGVERVGIDVSKWQASIDWDQVADAGIDFAIIRCGYGSDKESQDDGYFVSNVAGAQAAGIDIGVYLYSHAMSTSAAQSEAEHVLRMLDEAGLEPDDIDLAIYLDMEDSTQETLSASECADVAETFCNAIEDAGYTAGIYANKYWWQNKLTDGFFDTIDSKWVARYSTSTSVTSSTVDGTDIWQFTSSGSVPGIDGSVDVNFDYVGDGEAGTSREDIDALAAEYSGTLSDGTYAILSTESDRSVLDVADASADAGANVQLYGYNGTGAQLWKVTHDDAGYVVFENVGSGKVLGLEGDGNDSGTNVVQRERDGSYSHKWIVIPDEENGGYKIRSAAYSNVVIDIDKGHLEDGTNIQVYDANGSTAQSFQFISAEGIDIDACAEVEALSDGELFTIESALLDGAGTLGVSGSGEPGSGVHFGKTSLEYGQLFEFEFLQTSEDGSGYYRIVSLDSEMALAVENGEVVRGAGIVQYELDGDDDSQLWSVVANDDGTYTFVNKASGLALDASDGADTSSVQGYTLDGKDAQRFYVTERSDLLAEGSYSISSASRQALVLEAVEASEDGTGDTAAEIGDAASDGDSGSGDSGTVSSSDADDPSAQVEAEVELARSDSSLPQMWYVQEVSGRINVYVLESMATGGCLAAVDGDLVVAEGDGSEDQMWIPVATDDGLILQNVSSGNVIDASDGVLKAGSDAVLAASSGEGSQLFDFDIESSYLPDGTYSISLSSNDSLVIGVEGDSLSDSANVELQEADGSDDCQLWEVVRNDDDTYTISNCQTGRVLTVKGGFTLTAMNVEQRTPIESDAQKWTIRYAGGGFEITSALDTSLTLYIDGGTSDGDNVETQMGGTPQKFVFGSGL